MTSTHRITHPVAFLLTQTLYNSISVAHNPDDWRCAEREENFFTIADTLLNRPDRIPDSIEELHEITPRELLLLIQMMRYTRNDAFKEKTVQDILEIMEISVNELIRMDAARANASDATSVSNETTGSSDKRRRID